MRDERGPQTHLRVPRAMATAELHRRNVVSRFNEMRRPAPWDDHSRGDTEPGAQRLAGARTVVVGYDGSQAAQRALHRAAQAAGVWGRVVIVTATRQPEAMAVDTAGRAAVDEPWRLLDEAASILARYHLEVSTRTEEAEPAEALAETARNVNAALIVVGARGDSYLARALRGSVGEKLVSRAPCDLLVAR
jgi:nucleotide-binding universal stress UspA family protein